jgi:hypothetical protein
VAKLKRSDFVFRRHDTIGAEGAEEDRDFLADCFIDDGDLAALRDTQSPYRIVVGRTGVGKTALLLKLKELEAHVAWVEPDRLALQYIANSTILRRLEELGVDLDIFYRLLWRHVLAVELIKLRYRLGSESDQQQLLRSLYERLFRDRNKKAALQYLVKWGESFWEDIEYRVHEVTEKLERDVEASLAGSALLNAALTGGATHSEEDRREIVHRAQAVVNAVQIRRLQEVVDVLADDLFDDPQQRFFVVIDRLDERWVDDPLRYRLIRALIETIRSLMTIRSAKIILSIRRDLLDRVFRETRDPGFQEEKYQPLILPVQWSKKRLVDLIDRRIGKLVSRRYTRSPVRFADAFVPTVGKVQTADYLIQRTLYRPRDIIQLVNSCIGQAIDRSEITATMIRAAESDYSRLRLRSLEDEWMADFPEILLVSSLLHGKPASFSIERIDSRAIYAVIDKLINSASRHRGGLTRLAEQVVEDALGEREFLRRVAGVLYVVGLVGVRRQSGSEISWSFVNGEILRDSDISEDARLEVNPTFFRALGIANRP